MMNNHSYDLVNTLAEKSQALWRYDKYLEDSKSCEQCQMLWNKLKHQEEKEVEEMEKILTTHAKQDQIH